MRFWPTRVPDSSFEPNPTQTVWKNIILYIVAYVGGLLTIANPCILPAPPFVFSRADQPFRRSGLPLLAGMALRLVSS